MKKVFAAVLAAVIGALCLCGNAASVRGATYCEDGIMPLAATNYTVTYDSRTEDIYRMVLRHPAYFSTPYRSACACVAGANVIGFYDRYDENLIPNHKSGTTFQGQFLYSSEDTYTTEVVKQLYADMGTNNSGTTVTEFKEGMVTFCSRKGKSIAFFPCMKSGKFDYATAKRYMKSNLPVVLFCNGFNVADFDYLDGKDMINYYESTGNHVMVGFGYQQVTYTLSSSSTTYEYVAVASGTDNKSRGYYNINYNTTINDAYAINIY